MSSTFFSASNSLFFLLPLLPNLWFPTAPLAPELVWFFFKNLSFHCKKKRLVTRCGGRPETAQKRSDEWTHYVLLLKIPALIWAPDCSLVWNSVFQCSLHSHTKLAHSFGNFYGLPVPRKMKSEKNFSWTAINFITFSMISLIFVMSYLCRVLFYSLWETASVKKQKVYMREKTDRALSLIHKRKHCGLCRHGQN